MIAGDITGKSAQAWKLKLDEAAQRTCIGSFLVTGNFHAFWKHWVVSIVHLRDVEGFPPAHKNAPENTHEFIIYSVDSNNDPQLKPENFNPDTIDINKLQRLTPVDVVTQFEGTDKEAAQLLEEAVRSICDGYASPDQDWRKWWDACIPRSIEHMRTGGHFTGDDTVTH